MSDLTTAAHTATEALGNLIAAAQDADTRARAAEAQVEVLRARVVELEAALTPPVTNTDWVRGTWVLQQITTRNQWTQALRDDLGRILDLLGCTGLSLRLPWKLYATDPDLLDEGLALAAEHGKKFAPRVMWGRWWPDEVRDATPASHKFTSTYQGSRITVPLPFDDSKPRGADNAGNPHLTGPGFDQINTLAAWCRANSCRLLHLSWYGYAWAEIYHGEPLIARPGYSWDGWLNAHKELIAAGLDVAGDDLMVEWPLSGHLGGRNTLGEDLVTAIREQVGDNSQHVAVQGNGMGKVNQRPTSQPIHHGKQMWNGTTHPDTGAEYDWAAIYDALKANGELYVEVYRDSFSRANASALEAQMAAFGQ